MVTNNILALFCRLIKFYFITVYTEICVSKPLRTHSFSVQYSENATIVAYVGLNVKDLSTQVFFQGMRGSICPPWLWTAPSWVVYLESTSIQIFNSYNKCQHKFKVLYVYTF